MLISNMSACEILPPTQYLRDLGYLTLSKINFGICMPNMNEGAHGGGRVEVPPLESGDTGEGDGRRVGVEKMIGRGAQLESDQGKEGGEGSEQGPERHRDGKDRQAWEHVEMLKRIPCRKVDVKLSEPATGG
jgi:hypothetical protein